MAISPRAATRSTKALSTRAARTSGLVEQIEQEPLVGAPAVDHDDRLVEGAPQPDPCLVTGRRPRHDLGYQHRAAGREDVALSDGGVDPHARPGTEPQASHETWCRRETALGILGVEPGLEGDAARGWWLTVEPAALRHVQLQAHEVDARRLLGERVLGWEPGVDLEQARRLAVGRVEEGEGGGPAVAGADQHGGRGGAHGLRLGLREVRAVRLDDDLVAPPAQRGIVRAEGPHLAVPVGNSSHLEVTGTRDQRFEVQRRVAERGQRVGGGPLEDRQQVTRARRHAGCRPARRRRRP